MDENGARILAEAFYAALGADTLGVTEAIRRRDLAIARQLVSAGATAAEAAAYARDASAAAGRIAPVDLRSFERERLGWLARRRGRDRAERRVVDRTGQPPSWQTREGTTNAKHEAPVIPEVPEQAASRPVWDKSNHPARDGDQLAEKLRALMGGGRP